jgi:hypothetical protein
MAAGQFSCDGCGKSYAWKPEIAGKRVKCKCGGKLTVPATDPAASHAEPDGMGGFDDLMALADGVPAGEAAYAPAPAAAATVRSSGRSAGGGSCPSCGAGVDAAAVLCVNCGHNLKTGKKLKTSKVAGEATAAGGAEKMVPGYRSFGVKDVAGEGMSPQKKKIMAISLVVVLVGGVVGMVMIAMAGIKNDREHQARLNAKPAKLEKLIDNMDKAGGVGAAMHDGSLLNGVRDPVRESAEVQLAKQREFFKIKNRCDDMVNLNGPEAKAWLTASPKNHFISHDNAESVAIVDQLAALGATEIHTAYLPSEDSHGGMLVGGIVAKLPTAPAARKAVFAWYDGLPKMIEAIDQPHQREMGQTHISVEFKPD